MGTIIKSGIAYLGEGATTPFTGATASTDGEKGLVPAPLAGDESKFLKGDGTWAEAGSGSGLPENWEATSEHIKGIVEDDFNELGWNVGNDSYYYDTAATWSESGLTYTKSNDLPALGCIVYTSNNGYTYVLFVSTNQSAPVFTPNGNYKGSLVYQNVTWYYAFCTAVGGSSLYNIKHIGTKASIVAACQWLIDASEVYFGDYANKFAQISTPETGYLFAGGGLQANLSDATFKVESDGKVHGSDFRVNNTSILNQFTGATSSVAGAKGMVPAPSSGDQNKFLKGDGSWGEGGNANEQTLTWAEYQALTPEEQMDGTTYYITDANELNEDKFQPIIYSEEEREIGVWLDGRPLYERTFNSTTAADNQTPVVIADPGINTEIKNFYGEINGSRELNSALDNNTFSYSWITNNKHQVGNFAKGNVYISLPCIVTCQYTKTTDSPGSGQWTPQGVPAHHYSTDEQIIGTYLGETLYEKTYTVTAPSNNTSQNIIDITSLNVDDIPFLEGDIKRTTGENITHTGGDSFVLWARLTGYEGNQYIACTVSNSSYYSGVMHVTIRYTKTTS